MDRIRGGSISLREGVYGYYERGESRKTRGMKVGGKRETKILILEVLNLSQKIGHIKY